MSNLKVTAGRDGSRSFTDHDDRDMRHYGSGGRGGGGGRSRGGGRSYKQQRGRKKGQYQYGGYRNTGNQGRGGGRGPNPVSRLLDDDEIMSDDRDPGPSSRYNPYSRQRSRQPYNSRGGGRLAMDMEQQSAVRRLGVPFSSNHSRGSSGTHRSNSRQGRDRGHYGYSSNSHYQGPSWYKITIPQGKKEGKDSLIKSINNLSAIPFVPLQYQVEGASVIFYVQDEATASAIREVSRRITMSNGRKMIILVKGSPPPVPQMNPENLEKLKVAMSNRYDASTKELNLSRLHSDDGLKKEGLHLQLGRYNVMSKVIKIIEENIPELLALDVSHNHILALESMSPLSSAAPSLCRLNLGHNQIKNYNELNRIKQLKLEELFLEGNSLCDRFADQTSYIRDIRKMFPKIIRLDGHDLPPPITFELDAPTTLPATQGSHFVNDEVKKLVCQFLEQYYHIYDSDDRQSLLQAYHVQAMFSHCVFLNKSITTRQPNLTFTDSRNLFKVQDSVRRQRSLKQGQLNVVAYLNQLPSTQHDPASFVVDVSHASDVLLSFTVHGMYKEIDSKFDTPPIRAFSRTFVTVPQGSGIVITNEEFMITNASPEQAKKSFQNPAPTPSSSPVPVASTSAGLAPEVTTEMVRQFALQSGMNEEWSTKCLVQNDWNFEKAAQVFTELHAKGTIPPEAFVK